MRFAYVAVKLKIKELFNHKAYIAVLLMLPILILVLGGYGVRHIDEASLKVGVYVEEGTTLGQKMQEILIADKSISFETYSNPLQLEKDVAKAEIECGFVIKDSIEQVASGKNEAEAIEMLVSPATVAGGPVQETVGAAFFRLTAGEVAFETLKNKDYMQNAFNLKEEVLEKVESYYGEGDLMKVKLITTGSQQVVESNSKIQGVFQLCKGFIGVFLFVASLLLGVKITGERNSQIYKRFMTIKKSANYVEYANVISSSIFQVIVGSIALIILKGILKDYIEINELQEIGQLCLYIIVMNHVVLFVSLFIKEEQLWFGLIPVLSIACVIFCPIIVNLSTMNSILRYGAYGFITYYYLVKSVGALIWILLVSLGGYLVLSKRMHRI